MLYFWKLMLKSPIFWPIFSTNLSQKHKIICLDIIKLGANSKKLFLNPKSNFTICEINWQSLKLFLKSYNCFFDFPNFSLFGSFAQLHFNTGGNFASFWQFQAWLGSVADWRPHVFPLHPPPPFFPGYQQDLTKTLKYVWYGENGQKC